MKHKYFIIFIALLIAFTSVAVAADVDSGDTAGDISASVAANDVAQTVDAPVGVSDNGNDNKIIKNTQSDVKTENRPTPEVHNLNDSNFDEIITSTGLNGVNDGDVLNLTCDITRSNNSYLIDKAVSFEGNGKTIDLNTVYGYNIDASLLSPTYIEFNNGASNSNITNLKFHNTQVFTTTASNITFDNINVTVENQGVGKGTGYFSMRNGVINITVKNSYFYAVNNTGCSAIVITLGENCTIDNNTVLGSGKVGNLIYLNMYGATNNANNITKNRANKITNNIISCTDGENICWGITVTGPRNVIENNTIDITPGQYGITTTWAGSYDNVTNPNDTHNVSYYGNKYINNTVNGKFSTGNYSIIENNTINGASTINGHAHVTNNTFLAGVEVHNNVRFHSNDATGQTVTVKKANSCFKNNTIYKLSMTKKKANATYDCGLNNITEWDYQEYFVACNGNCPNCQPNNNNTLLKKSNQQLKTEASEILYQDDTCTIYNNGTAILKITKDNQRCLALGETNSHLNEYELTNIIVYVNEINYNSYPGYPYFNVNLGSNKENIDLKIVWNMTRNTHSQGFELRNFGYKSVTYENCKFYIKPIDEDGDNIYSWPIFSNVNVINSKFTYIATEDLFDYFNPNSGGYYFTELHYYTDPEHQTGGSDPGASINMFHIIGENNLFEGCTFELTTMQQDWDYKTYNNIIVFNNASNVTFNNNSFTITSMESDSSITPDNYAPLLNRTVNNLTFTNNDISIRYAQGIKLKTNNSLFENNTITVQHADNTIELTGDNNVVRYNTLTSKSGEGDSTVVVTGENNVVEQNPYVEPVLPKTIVVTQDNVDEVFGGLNNTLADYINAGDTLDFQGIIDKEHSLVINKPVNVISSTQDAVINLHTVAGSLMGEDPGNSFVINIGASGSFISGLYLNNTECWVHNVYDATLYNMTMHVQDARVGSGVGQTSLRYCNNVTMDSCHIYTENNGGSSSFVWTGCNNCTIINSIVQGEGNVGNLLYVGNPYNTQDKPANYTMFSQYNNIINCTVLGGSGGISNPLQNMANYTTIQGTKFYSGGSASAGNNGTFIDNEFYRTVSVSMTANCIAHGNIFYDTSKATVAANAQVYNNTFNDVTISGKGAVFEDNTVKGKVTISQPVNVLHNNLADVQVSSNGKTSNITNNIVTGTITSQAADVNIDSNIINTTNDYTVVVTGATNKVTNNALYTAVKVGDDTLNVKADTIVENNTPASGGKFEVTDETYSNFFDENGLLNNVEVTNYSTITLKGAFNDKVFKFDNIILSVASDNAVINNGFISTDNNAKIVLENVIFNNTKEGIEHSVLLNTDGNTVRNVKVYRTSDSGVSREIMVNGDNNKVVSNTFDLSVPAESIDYMEIPALSKASAIAILGSGNNISSNTITVRNTTKGFGTINVIDLAGKTKINSNTVSSNTINAQSSGYLYGINIGGNTDTNTINSNKITLNSDVYTAGIQIGYGPADANTINSNTVTLTSPIAYGIVASIYSGVVSDTTINSNNIYITAHQLAGIELCGTTPELINGATLTSNKVIVDGDYAIGIGVSGKNINLVTNTINVTGTTNATDDASYDIIKPTTAGLIIKNSDNVQAYNNTIEVVNGADIKLDGTSNSKVISTLSTATRFINAKNNVNIELINSNNNVIDTQKAFTDSEYSIILTGSSNNVISNNNLNASNLKGGNDAVKMDEASKDNTLYNNTPVIALLTDETYSTLFDRSGVYTFPEGVGILTLAGDLYNKDLTFTNNITFINADNFTIYNGTITLKDREDANYTDRFVTFRNININNVNKPVFVDNLTIKAQKNIQFYGGEFTVTGDNIVAFESVKDIITYTILDVYDANIVMEGKNVAAFVMTRDSYIQSEYLDVERCNITLKATDTNEAFKVINTNLDIYNNNIVQEGKTVSTLYATDVYANGQFFMHNNINATGDNIAVITLKDNHGSNPTFGNNTIIATSPNPVPVMNITNATNVYVGQGQYTSASYNRPNTIIVNADNGEVPVVYINANGYVRNNFIMSNDLFGVEAVNATTVSNITPTRTGIEITAPEQAKALDEITITVTVTNATASDGTIRLLINDEVVKTVTSNTLTYTYTPSTNGTDNIVAEYTNKTLKTISSSNNASISIGKIVTTITVESNRPFLNENLTISGTLSNEKDTAMANTEVTITLNGNPINVITDSQGNYNLVTSPQEGNNTIVVNYVETDAYCPSEASTTTFVVDLEKYALVDELNNTVNEQAQTIESMNNTINELNSTVNQQADTISNLNTTINNQATAIDDLTSQLETQENEIKQLNNTINTLSDILAQLLSVKDTTITVNSVADLTFNTGLTITGKLTDIDGNALTNSYVKVTVSGVDAIVQTDSKGTYKYTTTAKTIGENNVTVTYEGTDKYNPSTATTTFTVNKADCIITIDSVTSVKYGENVTIVGTFTSTTGKAISNSKVRIDINGKATYVKTDKNGVFVLTTTATKAGENILKASYGGSAYYNSYKTNITFNAEKQDIIITADETSYNDGTFTIKGTFKNAVGQAVKNTNVRVSINGKTYYAKTDANGTFTFTQDITGNKVTYTLGYGGSATYNAYTGTKTTLTFA